MAICTFCGTNMPRGTGKMYVKTDGRIFYFCSMKCEKNMLKLNRKPRTTRWTAEFAEVKSGGGAKAESSSKESAKAKNPQPKKQ